MSDKLYPNSRPKLSDFSLKPNPSQQHIPILLTYAYESTPAPSPHPGLPVFTTILKQLSRKSSEIVKIVYGRWSINKNPVRRGVVQITDHVWHSFHFEVVVASFWKGRLLESYRANDLCGNLICEYFCWMLGDSHFFRQITSFYDSLHYTKKQKKSVRGKF